MTNTTENIDQAEVSELSPKILPSSISISHAFSLFAIWFGTQFAVGLILGIFYGAIGENVTEKLQEIGMVSVYVSAIVSFVWVLRNISSENNDYRINVGWRRGELSVANSLLLVLIAFVGLSLLRIIYVMLVPEFENLVQNSAGEQMITATVDAGFGLMTVLTYASIMFVAPVIEEIVFRGYVQNALSKKYNPVVGIIIASSIFAVIHMNLAIFPVYFIMGLGFGVLFHRTQTLWSAIVLHMLNNIVAVITQVYF